MDILFLIKKSEIHNKKSSTNDASLSGCQHAQECNYIYYPAQKVQMDQSLQHKTCHTECNSQESRNRLKCFGKRDNSLNTDSIGTKISNQ